MPQLAGICVGLLASVAVLLIWGASWQVWLFVGGVVVLGLIYGFATLVSVADERRDRTE